ncbi:YfiR family protein [Variovorax sp. YR752]|uniref:YfiR family protein n=1 Tax=Variovorax sp. YR752 TaxID=1884383 RepID=UPI0031378A8C
MTERRLSPSIRRATAAWLLVAQSLFASAAAQAPPAEQPARVEAAFVRNFARYVSWPTRAFAGEHSPWLVCVLGNDPLDAVLESTLQGRTEQGRAFQVVRAARLEQLPPCQIVVVDFPHAAQRRAALSELSRRPVLTVGRAPEFLDEGGIVRLITGERIEMSINLDQARAASLTIPAKMLEVSREVLENGTLRRWR